MRMVKNVTECAMHKTNENYKSQDPRHRLIYLFYSGIDYVEALKLSVLWRKWDMLFLREGSGWSKKDKNEHQRDAISLWRES